MSYLQQLLAALWLSLMRRSMRLFDATDEALVALHAREHVFTDLYLGRSAIGSQRRIRLNAFVRFPERIKAGLPPPSQFTGRDLRMLFRDDFSKREWRKVAPGVRLLLNVPVDHSWDELALEMRVICDEPEINAQLREAVVDTDGLVALNHQQPKVRVAVIEAALLRWRSEIHPEIGRVASDRNFEVRRAMLFYIQEIVTALPHHDLRPDWFRPFIKALTTLALERRDPNLPDLALEVLSKMELRPVEVTPDVSAAVISAWVVESLPDSLHRVVLEVSREDALAVICRTPALSHYVLSEMWRDPMDKLSWRQRLLQAAWSQLKAAESASPVDDAQAKVSRGVES